tara:strand:- start:211076 stop:213631 length:2556 start_codon:yes stop_codon:yes gene_type:complete
LSEYSTSAQRYDECKTADGKVRPSWQKVVDEIDALGPSGLNERSQQINQLIRENGATFSIDSQSAKKKRPWKLATIPLVIDEASWQRLDTGLKQRVRLLEAVLDDLLGPQRLLSEGVFPPELLWSNPTFDRVYHQMPGADGHRLHVTATDLARDNSGNWWVTSDRTRAPSGLGYLLENRIISGRVFPQMFRRCFVRRVAGFFRILRDQMYSLAPRMRDNPRIALLTPGQDSYRHFEDAYLARYLGYTLVQGRDLAVRGNQLNLKTLGGLLPIDVLWRHVSDRKCDPLELEPNSVEGATGLLRTVREGNVAVTNSIGSVMAQAPAFLPFLPSACRFLLNEDLKLPSVATYWCGGKKELSHVLSNLDTLLIRPAFAITGNAPINPASMTAAQRDHLIAQLKTQPHRYIAQERLLHSTTPVWHEGKMHSWHLALRSFQVQTSDDVHTLPGGLSRVSDDEDTLGESPHAARLSQDCWISCEQPAGDLQTLLPRTGAAIRITRSGDELPSRVAEHLFWLGRYAERCELIARLLRTALTRLVGEQEISDLPEMPGLVAALATIGQIEPDYAIDGLGSAMPDLELHLPSSVFDMSQPRGLQSSIQSILYNAAAVRDRISIDAYRIIKRVGDDLATPGPVQTGDVGPAIERLNRLVTDLLAFSGLASESITRTHGWRFLQLGRRIERTNQTAELLTATLVQPARNESRLNEAVLETTDSLMTYRSRYLGLLQPEPVLDLLVTDETNPRSILFQLERIDSLLRQLPSDTNEVGLGPDQRIAEELLHPVRLSNIKTLSQREAHGKPQENGKREALEALMIWIIDKVPALSNAIEARYLIHTGVTQVITGQVAPSVDDELTP